MRTSVLLIFLATLHGIVGIDPFLKRLCLSPYIDSPLETDITERIQGETCVQKFPYKGTWEQHETFCRSALPFEAQTESSDSQVICTWSISSECNRQKVRRFTPEITYIHGKCYSLGDLMPCHEMNFPLATPMSFTDLRWISIIYGQSKTITKGPNMALKISPGDSVKVKEDVRYRSGLIYKAKGKHYKDVVLILNRMSMFETYPGDVVPQDDNLPEREKAAPLCLVPSIVTEGSQNTYLAGFSSVEPAELNKKFQSLGSGSAHTVIPLMKRKSVIGYAIVTRNEYQPVLTSEGIVDLSYFHSQCEKICDDCYVASYEIVADFYKVMPRGRFYVSGTRKQTKLRWRLWSLRRQDYIVKNNANSEKGHITKFHQWQSDYPIYECEDQERVAIQMIIADGVIFPGYVNVPAFDRQPLICISGPRSSDGDENTGECYKNSVKSGDGCECKDGFTDVLDIPNERYDATQQGITNRGRMCVEREDCESPLADLEYGALIFMIDGSTSYSNYEYEHGIQFVKRFNNISNGIPILFYQYSSVLNRTAILDKGWSKAEFLNATEYVMRPKINYGTDMFYNMEGALDLVKDIWPPGKIMLVVTTDGGDGEVLTEELRQRRFKEGIDVYYITLGDDAHYRLSYVEEFREYNVYALNFGPFSKMDDGLETYIRTHLCNHLPTKNVYKARFW